MTHRIQDLALHWKLSSHRFPIQIYPDLSRSIQIYPALFPRLHPLRVSIFDVEVLGPGRDTAEYSSAWHVEPYSVPCLVMLSGVMDVHDSCCLFVQYDVSI